MNILLVSPAIPNTFWSFKHVLRFVSARAAFPPLGLLTVAGMLPRHWQLQLVDMEVEALRDQQLAWADYVMVSAMIVHRESVQDVARRCHAMGKTVIGGGPLFTTGHVDFPTIDHFVLGEAEDLIDELIADMERGELAPVYTRTERPDLSCTPVPRWDLIKPQHYASLSVQCSRGCPYDCEFCDIVIMNGRRPRTKSPAQVLRELDALVSIGWTGTVFVVDDNFIGNKGKTRALLRAMIDWREATGTRMTFYTEASMNLAKEEELMDLMVRAGFKKVFVGIESPSAASLQECHKVQNMHGNVLESVHQIQRAGIEVMGGFIVGFDSDESDIFERQSEFIRAAGVATAMVGLLTALPMTRLHDRLQQEGRLRTDSSGNNTTAAMNFVPKLPTEFLVDGYRRLMRSLYEPRGYYARIAVFLSHYNPSGPPYPFGRKDIQALVKSMWTLGLRYPGRWAYWHFLTTILLHHRRSFSEAISLAIYGHHFRLTAADL